MRPLKLRISGLRSYRSEETIDFGEPGLMAIVGDTGSGKSSILEALFFALYGGCTWDLRAVNPLISDGANVMQVELTFLAEGRQWRVFRSASRSSAQSRHELECLDDPSVRFDNDSPVTDEIKRLVGLDPSAFLRTVILPQGRFQMLLQATPADRTAILKGIFRLDQLAAARDQADSIARRLRPGLEALKLERAALLPDPRAALADARQRHDQAHSRQAELQQLSDKISAATGQRENADRQASDLETREQAARQSLVPTASDELATLAATAEQLDEQRQRLEGERGRRRDQADSLAALLKQADDKREGIEGLAGAASTVSSLLEQLPGLLEEAAECEQQARELGNLSATLQEQETEAGSLQARATDAQGKADRLAAATKAASDQVNETRTRLVTARNAAAVLHDLQIAAQQAAERVQTTTETVQAASTRSETATAELDDARSALEAIQRANAAAHAAEACQPGDPCPICDRPLPASFTVPVPPGDSAAHATLSAAEKKAQEAVRALAAREADLTNASDSLNRTCRLTEEADEALARAIAQLRMILPQATLDTDDEALATSLEATLLRLTGEHDTQDTEARLLGQEAAAAAAKADTLRGQVQKRADQLGNRQDSVRKRQGSYEGAAAALPARYRVPAPLTVAALEETSEHIEQRRAELNQIDRKVTEIRGVIEDVGRSLEDLNDTRRTEVDEPWQRLIPKLTAAAQRLTDLTGRLGMQPAPARPDGGLADDATWAAQLQERADMALTQAQHSLAEARRQRTEALATIDQALADAEADDEPALQQIIIDVSAVLSRAADDIKIATEQIPHAAQLDDAIKQAGGLLEALDELMRLLADSKFIAYVVTRKQQTLLAIATEVLGSMTGERYGFSDTFDIVDRLTGLPRGVKTLSGGETFLASLALALGLVELAGRGGGRLDAFFLDEGFGSLDANSLAEALDALGRQAETGRLVAVISHLRSVAENMDRVLAVTLGPDGSRTRWVGGDEKDELIAKEIEASLLS